VADPRDGAARPGGPRAWAFLLPEPVGFLEVRQLAPAGLCGRLDDSIETEIRSVAGQPLDLRRAERAQLGDASAFLEVVQDGILENAYLICDGRSAIRVSVFGDAEALRDVLDEVAATLAGGR
jgi:hypothetical protein